MDREFTDYVKNHVKDFLPEEYADADVTIKTVTKSNDLELSGIIIRRPGEGVVSGIDLEPFEEERMAGKPLGDVTEHVAETYLKYWGAVGSDWSVISDYEKAKERLSIALCDPENNGKYLEDKTYDKVGAYAAVYRIDVVRMDDGTGSIPVTDEILGLWGVTREQLHKDAVATGKEHDPARLYSMDDRIRNMLIGEEEHNLLNDTELPVSSVTENAGINMYVLTSESELNGASVIARDGLLERVGEIFGSDYYILPSSVHELILVPDNGMIRFEDLNRMVREVNDAELKTEDLLSYKVQRYDRESQSLGPELAESHNKDLVSGQDVYSSAHVYRDYNDLTAQVAFADCVPAPDIGPDAMVPVDTKRMSLGDFLDRHKSARDGRYARVQVMCKNMNTAEHLDFELQRQYARFHPDADTNICDMGRIFMPDMEDGYEIFYGRWTPSFLENAADLLQNTVDLCGSDSVQIRIINTDVENLINLQLEENKSEYRLVHMDIDLPDKQQHIFVRIVRGENDGSGTIIPKSALEALGVDRGISYIEELDREYNHFGFDREGIRNGTISLGDSREKLCSVSGGQNAYDHDFSRYRVVFRNVNPLEADAIGDAVDCCDKTLLRMSDNDANGWKITVLSLDPEAAIALDSELRSRGVECAVSGAYTFAVDNELVLEAVTRHGSGVEMSEANYRAKPDGSVSQTGEPRLESFASAVERERGEMEKQFPKGPCHESEVERNRDAKRNRGIDMAM